MVPSDLLEHWIPQVPRGHALDIGAGEGDVSIWLVGQGFKVEAVERDQEVCMRLIEACDGLDISIHAMDMMDFTFPPEQYVLIYAGAVLHFIKPTELWTLADRMVLSLVPGGFLIAEVFTIDDPGYDELRSAGAEEIEPNTFKSSLHDEPIHYFMPGELARTFSSLQIQSYEETRYLDPEDAVGYRSGALMVAKKSGIRRLGNQ